MGAPGAARAAGAARKHVALVVLAAGLAIAAPLAGSQLIDNPFGSETTRGGGANTVLQSTSPSSPPPAPPASPASPPPVVPVPRGRPTKPRGTTGTLSNARGQHATLPHTT